VFRKFFARHPSAGMNFDDRLELETSYTGLLPADRPLRNFTRVCKASNAQATAPAWHGTDQASIVDEL
jgi:hypothetical protein